MANSPGFVTHALELLAAVGQVEARAMFGGHGVYAQGVMFGLLDDDELFLKADELSRPRFVEAGCRQWVWVGKTQRMESTGYFRPPDEAHEDPEAMASWAALALASALRKRAAKGAGGTRKAKPARAAKPPRSAGKAGGASARARPKARAGGAKRSRGRARPR